MAAASDSAPAAVAFLETSLGTRFAVSFPSRGTTVADLKRQVSAEHSACFPGTGPISVTSLQVERGGFWYVLSDAVDVQAAFSEGTWHLRVEADQLPPRPAPAAPARTDPERGTTCDADAGAEAGAEAAEERSASAPVSLEPSQNMEPSADPEPEGGGDLPMHQEDSGLDLALALAAGYSDKEPTSHQGTAHQECLERPSGEDGSNMQLQSLERLAAAAAGNREIPPPSCQGNPHPQAYQEGIPRYSDSEKEGSTRPMSMAEKMAQPEACFPRRQRFIAVRKMPRSIAKKHGLSSTGSHQEHSLKYNKEWTHKMSEKEGVQKLNKQSDSKEAVRSSSRITDNGVSIGQKAVRRKIKHNLEVPGHVTSTARDNKCTICGKGKHNRRTCPLRVPKEPAGGAAPPAAPDAPNKEQSVDSSPASLHADRFAES